MVAGALKVLRSRPALRSEGGAAVRAVREAGVDDDLDPGGDSPEDPEEPEGRERPVRLPEPHQEEEARRGEDEHAAHEAEHEREGIPTGYHRDRRIALVGVNGWRRVSPSP